MWIVFGWDKETTTLGEVGTAYCYDCRRRTAWFVVNESEWVTFSALRVFRFIHRQSLHCESCSAVLRLSPAEFRQIDRHMKRDGSIEGTAVLESLRKRVETEQLAGKTDLQLRFIRQSMQAQQEYEQTLSAQQERERLAESRSQSAPADF